MKRHFAALAVATLIVTGCSTPGAPPAGANTPEHAPSDDSVTLQIETFSWGFFPDGGYSETSQGTMEATLAPGNSITAPGGDRAAEFTFVGFDNSFVVLESSEPLKLSEAQSPDNASTTLRFFENGEYWSASEDGGEYYTFIVVN